MVQYVVSEGAQFNEEAAGILAERFAVLADDGLFTPQGVVDDARPEESPTHPFFEWNDAVAAENHRKQQARHYINHIRIIEAPGSEPVHIAHHVVVKGETDDAEAEGMPCYALRARLLSDRELIDQVRDDILRQLRAAQRRLREIDALAQAASALDQAIEVLRLPMVEGVP